MNSSTQLCADIIAQGLKLGATDMAASLTSRKSVKAVAFDQHPQGTTINQSTTLALEVYIGQRKATLSTDDLLPENITATLAQAIKMARDANEDPYVGLAEPALYSPLAEASFAPDHQLLPAAELVKVAQRLEAAIRRTPGVCGIREAYASSQQLTTTLITSNGFAKTTENTFTGIGADVAAEKGGIKTSFGDDRYVIHAADLPNTDEFGLRIGQEAAARFKQGKLKKSGLMPVVLHPDVARDLVLAKLAHSMNALAIHEGKSWLKSDHLGQSIAPKGLNIIDHWNLPKGIGSRLFDGSGISGPEQLNLLEGGVLQHLMVGLRGSRKSSLMANGRGSSTNLWLQPGRLSVAELMADISYGLYVTDTMGSGYNMLTGDLSYSVGGYIIEQGEMTDTYVLAAGLAGNFQQMLQQMTPANDLQMHRKTNAPTLRIEGLTVTGDISA